MILHFSDRATADIFHGENTKAARRVPPVLWKVACRKLDMLNAAHRLQDLMAPPNNRLEGLHGKWTGFHSIRVNDQFRVVFKWVDGHAKNVQITDYH